MNRTLAGLTLGLACGNLGGLAAAQPREPPRLKEIPLPTPAEVRFWAQQLGAPNTTTENRREAVGRLTVAWAQSIRTPDDIGRYPAVLGITADEFLQFTLSGLDAAENPLTVEDAANLLAKFIVPVRVYVDTLLPRLNGRNADDCRAFVNGLLAVCRADRTGSTIAPFPLLAQRCVFDYPEMAGHKKSKELVRRVDPAGLLQRMTEEDARWKLSDCEWALSVWLVCTLDPAWREAARELALQRDDSWIVRGVVLTTRRADAWGLKPLVKSLGDSSMRVAEVATSVLQSTAEAEAADDLRAAMEAADSLDRKLLVFSASARLRVLAPDRERWRVSLRAEAKRLNRDIEMDIEELPESVQR